MLHPSLNALRRQVRAFDASVLTIQLAALQLSPANAHSLELLELACAASVLEWGTQRTYPTENDIRRLLSGPAFNTGLASKLDDPHEHFFASYFSYQGSNHVVFPGATLGGTRPLEAVVGALETRPDDFDSVFHTQVCSLISGTLKISTYVAGQAGLGGHSMPAGWHRDSPERPKGMPLVTALASETHTQQAAACTLTFDVLNRILTTTEVDAVSRHLTGSGVPPILHRWS